MAAVGGKWAQAAEKEKKFRSLANTDGLDFDNLTSTESVPPDDPESGLPFGLKTYIMPVLRQAQEKIQRATSKAEEQKVVGILLNEALTTVNADPNSEEIKRMEETLQTMPFTKYREDSVVALKKGIPMDRFLDYTKALQKRYSLPQNHIDELSDAMFTEVNQVSLTEFFFHQDHDSSSKEAREDTSDDNSFAFARMVVYRREVTPGLSVLDLGYCFFNVKFRFGDEMVVRKLIEERDEMVPKFFWFFRVGSEKTRRKTITEKEEMRKFQLTFGSKDTLQDYFRWKAVNVLSQDMIKGGSDGTQRSSHPGIKLIKNLP